MRLDHAIRLLLVPSRPSTRLDAFCIPGTLNAQLPRVREPMPNEAGVF